MLDIITVGSAVRDTIYITNAAVTLKNPKPDPTKLKLIGFEYGAKIHSDAVEQSYGGGASNTAVALAKLGLKVAAYVRVGEDSDGRAIKDHLAKRGVGTQFVQVDKEVHTGFSMLVVEAQTKEHVALVHYGANRHLQFHPELVKQKPGWFYIASLSTKHWSNLVRKLVATQANIAWNPGSIQLAAPVSVLRPLLKKVTLLVLNKDEATELALRFGLKRGKREYPVKQLAQALKALGPKLVLITNSGKGAYAYDGKVLRFAKASSAKAKDTTGAGDCFGSSFVAGLIRTKNIDIALKVASMNAAAEISKVGAQTGLLSWGHIAKRLKLS